MRSRWEMTTRDSATLPVFAIASRRTGIDIAAGVAIGRQVIGGVVVDRVDGIGVDELLDGHHRRAFDLHAVQIIVEIVRKQAGQIGFAVHPRRWVVERFFAGSGATVVWRRTSRPLYHRQQPSSMPLQSCSSHDGSLVRFGIRVRL